MDPRQWSVGSQREQLTCHPHQCQHHQLKRRSLHHTHTHTHTSLHSLLSGLSCNSSSSFSSTNSLNNSAFCGCVPVALGVLVQFLHLQPGPHLLPILHCRVLHAVTLEHEQPRNCRPSWCLTASTDSQSHSNFSSKIFQPYWVMSGYVMFFWQPNSTYLRLFAASGNLLNHTHKKNGRESLVQNIT